MFTPDQYAQIAKGYDNAAADPLVPEDKRWEFAKRAEWFHYLAARDPGAREKGSAPDVPAQDPSRSPRKSFAPFLTTLWLTGAGLYLIGTLLFTNAIGVFDKDHSRVAVKEVTLPVESEPQVARVAEKAKAMIPTAERPHAISPHQPSYEAPELTLPVTQGNSASGQVEAPSISPVTEPEMFQVTKATTIRNAPSARAKVIGTATPGAQLQVKRQENEWIEFVDPSSGNTGWIESNLVAQSPGSRDVVSTTDQNSTPQKRSVARVVKQKTSPLKAAQSRPKPGRSYTDLPVDDDFIQDDRGGRRMGLFARRRMLGEGLMSPGFLPPP